RARPKSLMLKRPADDRSRLEGLMSRWITLFLWAWSRASATSAIMRATVSKYLLPEPSSEDVSACAGLESPTYGPAASKCGEVGGSLASRLVDSDAAVCFFACRNCLIT